MSEKRWLVDLEEAKDDSGDLIMPLPEDFLETAGWKEGDVLNWKDNGDGSYSITKNDETEWVLVECVSTFRQRYMVEVPKGQADWALDTVTIEAATEFSQQHIGEQIVSHRVVTKEEALTLCDLDNDYCSTWDEETKMKNFFTRWVKK